MTREEFLKKLQLCYFGEKKAFNEIVKYFDTLQSSLQTQCQSLQTKIDEAIEFTKDHIFQISGDKDFEYLLQILERTDK